MSSSVNKAILIGHLGQDPELRHTQSGKAVCNFSLATNEHWGGEDHTEWHKIICWEKLAEICGKHLVKGRQVYVEGKIQTRQWEDREGQKRYTTEIVARQVAFLGPKVERQAAQQNDYSQPPLGDDDVPF